MVDRGREKGRIRRHAGATCAGYSDYGSLPGTVPWVVLGTGTEKEQSVESASLTVRFLTLTVSAGPWGTGVSPVGPEGAQVFRSPPGAGHTVAAATG